MIDKMNKEETTPEQNGIVVCGVCKNVAGTLPVIRAAFEELVAKSGVPCWARFYENNSDDGTPDELIKWAQEVPVFCAKDLQEKNNLHEVWLGHMTIFHVALNKLPTQETD
jgi:hypothetical protein